MNYLEILGTIIGLVYLYLEYRASAWLWIASIAMPAVYLGVYYDAGLYADFGISVYYILASVYGLVCWLKVGRDRDSFTAGDLPITSMPGRLYFPVSAVLSVVFVAIGYVLSRFTDSMVPWADAATTAVSIVAMWMLARKYVEQWLAWIVADIGCVMLYVYKELWFTAGLYLVYAVIAVFGYREWRRKMD